MRFCLSNPWQTVEGNDAPLHKNLKYLEYKYIMKLYDRLNEDIKQAMRNKEADRLLVIRMLKSAIKYTLEEQKRDEASLTDADVITAVRKELKKRSDSIESFKKGGRNDLAAKEESEVKVLESYLPAALSSEEVENLVKAAIAEVGATSKAQMGTVMKLAQTKSEGRVDNKTISSLLQKLLP